jgi:hypothetical protein
MAGCAVSRPNDKGIDMPRIEPTLPPIPSPPRADYWAQGHAQATLDCLNFADAGRLRLLYQLYSRCLETGPWGRERAAFLEYQFGYMDGVADTLIQYVACERGRYET